MDQRLAWVSSLERSGNAAAVCRHFGISRATLRKWWRRYEAEGVAGLAERSRAPATSPTRKLFEPDLAAIRALRAEGLGFGRIRDRLKVDRGQDVSISTIRRLLARDAAQDATPAPPSTPPPGLPEGLVGQAAPEGLAALLAEAIERGHFRPGEKLTEETLARRYGTGRTRVREALRNLAFLGIVRIERNRGAFVALPSADDVARAYEARRVVEAAVIRSLGPLGPGQLATLRQHVERQAAAEAAGQRLRHVQLLTEFHLVLAGMGPNGFLREFVAKLAATTSLAVVLYDRAPPPCCAVQEHAALVDHLAAGRVCEAVGLMERHLGSNQARVEQTGG